MNPLLENSTLEFEAIDFPKIKTSDFLPALDEAIKIAKVNFDKIKEETDINFDSVNKVGSIKFECKNLLEFNYIIKKIKS